MYHAIMKYKLKAVFAELNKGDYQPVLSTLATNFTHAFAGNHCLGGQRTSKSAYRQWFERLFRIFPDITFTLTNIVVQGPPWNTWVTIEWQDRLTTRDHVEQHNQGAHVMHFRWAKATQIRIYLDTQRIQELLAIQHAHGIDEAHAMPIGDSAQQT